MTQGPKELLSSYTSGLRRGRAGAQAVSGLARAVHRLSDGAGSKDGQDDKDAGGKDSKDAGSDGGGG
ncbi:MAG: hypothetical protein ACRDZP_02125, partial [Acidimicrobiales bacterium]